MNYLIVLSYAIICCFGACFAIQYPQCENKKMPGCMKCLLPKGKEYTIMFILVIISISTCAVFLEFIYDNAILDNIKFISILGVLCVAAYTDWDRHIIQNKLLLCALCLRMLLFIFELMVSVEDTMAYGFNELVSAVLIFIVGFLCSVIVKGSVGMGDVKLMSVMALFLGASGVVSAIIISLIVSFFYCVAALFSKKKKRKDIIPFAPSLLFGAFISLLLFGI